MEFLKWLKRAALNVLGDMKIYRFPFFIIYDPTTFRVKGSHTREAMEALMPGDVLHRKYVNYMDGYLIPGKFSHSGIYVGGGKVVHAMAEGVSEIDVIDFLRCDGFAIRRQDDPALAEKAVERARSWIGRPYDFDFLDDDSGDKLSLYCHELAARAYAELEIPRLSSRIMGMRFSPRYLAESFVKSGKFHTVMEICPG